MLLHCAIGGIRKRVLPPAVTARALGGGVCRRDLKTEEFLVLTKKTGEKNALKVTGQELSCTLAHGQVPTTKAGSFSYITPQALVEKQHRSSEL